MLIIYNLIYFFLFILSLPYLVWKRKLHSGFWTRAGFFPRTSIAREKARPQPSIWLHAVSVGEVRAVSGLLRELKKKLPQFRIILTTVTPTGYSLASQLKEADIVLFAPLDFSFVVEKYIRFIRPQIYISVETEIWPNLFLVLKKNNVPIVLVNGRISDKSFERYFNFRFLFKKILEGVIVFCMQSPRDAERIIALGIPKEKVKVVGNLKFDDLPAKTEFRLEDLDFTKGEVIWIAGSTHAGEEEIVFKIFKSLSKQFPNLRLIIAPRHVERTKEVLNLAAQFGFRAAKFSDHHPEKVIVVDTIGPLKSLYSLSHIVFVGKSLVAGGGQNIIEPAFFGKPIVVGPLMQNFKDITKVFLKEEGIVQVQNAQELEEKIKFLLNHPEERNRLGQAAKRVIEKNKGATEKSLEVIEKILGNS